jgi:hypothetical protein
MCLVGRTREERLAHMENLLAPMRAYLHELDEPEANADVTPDKITTIATGRRRS